MARRDDAQPARLRFDGEAKRVVVRRPRLGRDGWALFSRRSAAQSVTLTARELQALFEGRTVAVDVVGKYILYVAAEENALHAAGLLGALMGIRSGASRTGTNNAVPNRADPEGAPTHRERVLAARIRVRLDRQSRRPRVRTPEWIVRLANSGPDEAI